MFSYRQGLLMIYADKIRVGIDTRLIEYHSKIVHFIKLINYI